MQSKEGSIQGCPLSMFLYGIGVLPLIRKLKELHPDVIQPWFADDAAGAGGWEQLRLFYEDLLLYGPAFGYNLNPEKCKVVVHPNEVEAATLFFNTQQRWGFEICTGTRYLGEFIGTKREQDLYVSEKVLEWVSTVKELSMVANQHFPHFTYTGMTKSLQHQ